MASLAGGLPSPDHFPVELLRGAFERAMVRIGSTGPTALQYAPTEGLTHVRSFLAAHDGVDVDEVLVTTGSQQGLHLLARVLCDPGDVVVVEDPTYLGALQAFRAADATVVGVPGDADGLDTEALADTLASGLRPRAVYVCATFANPTGATLTAARRTELVGLADRYGFVVIEDDPYGALRFDPEAPAVVSMAGSGRPVVRLRTASKVLAPGLRVGWMTGPASVVAAAALAKQAIDLHTSALDQSIVAEAMADPGFAQHVDAVAAVYADRAGALVVALGEMAASIGVPVELAPPAGGMFVWARLDGIDTDALLPAALDHDVAFVPGSAFAVGDGHRDRVRLSFATLTPSRLADAVERLGSALSSLLVTSGR